MLKPPLPIVQRGHPLNRGLVGAWLFTEGAGLLAQDCVNGGRFADGSRQDGRLTAVTQWTQGNLGRALSFNGTSEDLQCGGGTPLSRFSVAAWVYPTSFADYRTIICRGNGANRNYEIDLEQTTGKMRVIFTDGSNSFRTLIGNTGLTLNKWTHIIGTFDGATLAAYVNGIVDGNVTAAFAPDVSTIWVLRIGSLLGANYFAGNIAEVRLFNRALAPQEVRDLYASTYREFAPPPAIYAPGTAAAAASHYAVTVISG